MVRSRINVSFVSNHAIVLLFSVHVIVYLRLSHFDKLLEKTERKVSSLF